MHDHCMIINYLISKAALRGGSLSERRRDLERPWSPKVEWAEARNSLQDPCKGFAKATSTLRNHYVPEPDTDYSRVIESASVRYCSVSNCMWLPMVTIIYHS